MGLVFLRDGEEMWDVTLLSAQDEKSWYEGKLKREQFLGANYIFLRSVEHQDRRLRVGRDEDGQESSIIIIMT